MTIRLAAIARLLATRALPLLICGTSVAAEPITVASFSTLIPVQRSAFADDHAQRSGSDIRWVAMDRVMAPLREQVMSGQVQWDVVDMNLPDALQACAEGLLERIDPARLPAGTDGRAAAVDFLPGMLQPCSVGNLAWSNLIAHRSDTATRATLRDFFDTQKFPGKRALNPYPYMNLERALLADGVPPNRVYAVLATAAGEDRAFAKLAALKPHLLWLGPELKAVDALLDRRVVFAAVNNGSLFRAQFENRQPLAAVWDGQMWTVDVWAIPRGTPHREAALAFIAQATGSRAQAAQAELTSWGAVRRSAVSRVRRHPKLGIAMQPHAVTSPRNLRGAVLIDAAFWNSNLDRLAVRFQREFGVYRAPYAAERPASGPAFRDCADCPEMVALPPGRFTMGSSAAVTDREQHAEERVRDERPRHEVTIAYSLAVSSHEITRGEFAAFARDTGFQPKADCWVKYNGGGGAKVVGRTWLAAGGEGAGIVSQDDGHPVICVGWDDAVDYAAWLQRRTGKPYRLLSEAEWEYAALGSTTPVPETLRPWGDDPHRACEFANAPDSTAERVKPGGGVVKCTDGFARTAPVGSFAPNAFGLYDMLGNVWEWVADCWNDSYSGARIDGSRGQEVAGCRRVMRGGSWSESLLKFRTAARGKGLVDDRGDSIGLRVAYPIEKPVERKTP